MWKALPGRLGRWSCICSRASREGSFSSGVAKNRVENAGPVGEVEVCAEAVVVIVPAAAMMASASIDLRMWSSLVVLVAVSIVAHGGEAKGSLFCPERKYCPLSLARSQ